MRVRVRGLFTAMVLAAVSVASALTVTACSTVHSTGFRTSRTVYAPHRGPVRVSGARDPDGGTEVGTVQASGYATIEALIPELVERTAQLGGNYVRIDHIVTRFEVQVLPYAYGYNCGSARFPVTCTSTSFRPEEVSTMVIQGRAFRVGEPTP